MGRLLTNQKRGKGSPAYRTPGHRFIAKVTYPEFGKDTRGQIVGFALDPAHSTPLAHVITEDGNELALLAAEGLAVNDEIRLGYEAEQGIGNVSSLGALPDGTPVFNVEIRPRDGGKLLRATGATGTIIMHDEDTSLVKIKLGTSSKRILNLSPECRVTVGVAAGGGRKEKPFKKAGNKVKAMKARNKYYPKVRGSAMNACSHPHGGKSIGKPSTVGKDTPPGRRVGHVAARQTGRKKRRQRGSER
jgi:large subunit ribosomal protein L2